MSIITLDNFQTFKHLLGLVMQRYNPLELPPEDRNKIILLDREVMDFERRNPLAFAQPAPAEIKAVKDKVNDVVQSLSNGGILKEGSAKPHNSILQGEILARVFQAHGLSFSPPTVSREEAVVRPLTDAEKVHIEAQRRQAYTSLKAQVAQQDKEAKERKSAELKQARARVEGIKQQAQDHAIESHVTKLALRRVANRLDAEMAALLNTLTAAGALRWNTSSLLTICEIIDVPSGRTFGVGVAKRHAYDEPKADRGRRLAFTRALLNLDQRHAQLRDD